MDGQILPQASLFLGIIPALLLLYISLKGYDEYYKDKNIYLSFVGGLIIGFISAIIEQFSVAVGILFIILFPVLEQISKTMLLNIRRLQANRETPIYGLTLGLGFGAIFVPFSIITANMTTSDLLNLVLLLIGSFGIILMHGATGILLGYGILKQQLIKYFAMAVLYHIPIPLLIFLTTSQHIEFLQVGVIFYGIIIYWYISTRILPQIKTHTEKRKRTTRIIKENS
ncbi:MAG: protease PrsW [Candidatus Thermoplasmatota archaeon]|nr:protease PrsW [Candidatus Thermoplasmatota archaeon]MBU1940473.1 protease PrsW [Candidatus Thermoplasmatota archaeon]